MSLYLLQNQGEISMYGCLRQGQDPELGLCYAELRYEKFPLFQQLKFDIARLSRRRSVK